MSMFTPNTPKRTLRFLLRISQSERDFLQAEAQKRGILVTALIRECVRKTLKPDVAAAAPEKQVG